MPTTYEDVLHRHQQSVFLIFWTQNLVKGLPLRRLLNPSGPIWSYLRGVTEIVSIGVGGPTGCVRVLIMFRRPSVVAGATTNNADAATFKMPTTADTAHCINNQKSPWPSPLASMGSDHRPKQRSIIMAEEIVGSPPMATTQYQWYHRRPADDNNPESF